MPAIARLGDTSSHGGSITTAASKSYCEGAKIARKGDTLLCPIHGPQAIVTGSQKLFCEDAEVARTGDLAACGAALISSATKSYDE